MQISGVYVTMNCELKYIYCEAILYQSDTENINHKLFAVFLFTCFRGNFPADNYPVFIMFFWYFVCFYLQSVIIMLIIFWIPV